MAQALTMFRDGWRLYRAHARTLLSTAALLLVPLAGCLLLGRRLAERLAERVPWLGWTEIPREVVVSLFEMFIDAITAGAVIVVVSALRQGRSVSWRQAWRAALDRARPLAWTTLLLIPPLALWTVVWIIPFALFAAFAVKPFVESEALVFASAFIPAYVIASTRYALVTVVCMREGLQGTAAIHRAVELTRGRWRLVFATAGLLTGLEFAVNTLVSELVSGWGMDLAWTATSVLTYPLWGAILVLLYEVVTQPQASDRSDAATAA